MRSSRSCSGCASTTSTCLTLGQYLQPSRNHLPVQRFVHPDTFAWFAEEGEKMGFKNVASGPLVRSSYHADQQAHGNKIG